MGGRFWAFLAVIFVFTLGNSTDAFLLLRAKELGVPVALAPILWALLNGVKSISNVPGGSLSDRIGRRPTLIAGWVVYARRLLSVRARDAGVARVGAVRRVRHLLRADRRRGARAGRRRRAEGRAAASAYGWYYLAIGIGALPASLMFGVLWDRFGSPVAFAVGAGLAMVAAAGLFLLPTAKT